MALLVLALALVGPPVAHAAPRLVAERITSENFDTHHVGGPDADGGIDDWFLSNGTICAVISDPEHESPLTPRGGVLIDLGHCGADDDQWNVLQPMLNLSQSHVVPVESIEAWQEADRAWIRTRALFAGVEILTTYALDRVNPRTLQVSTRARRIAAGGALFSFGQLVLHTNGQTPVFSLDRRAPDTSVGFAYPDSDRRSFTSLLSALIASDLTVLVGADGLPPISYGIERVRASVREGDDTREQPLGTFSVTGLHFTFVAALTRPPWIGSTEGAPSLLQLAQLPLMDVDGPQEVAFDQRIHVGDRADVASITDRVFAFGALVEGTIDDPEARIHVDRASGAPLTQIRPDASGRFSFRLPRGDYRVRALAPGGRRVETTLEITDYDTPPPALQLALGARASIDLPRGFVGRLTFVSEGGTLPAGEPVVFGDNLLGQRIGARSVPGGSESRWLNLAGAAGDPRRVVVPPGRYRVLASRGPEYDVVEVPLEARAGETQALALAPLARVAPTPGWIGADHHVHSGESFDSGTPQEAQIAAFAASGAELLVATEHDRIFDPRPAIARAGLAGRLVSITGIEATSAYEGGDSPHATGHLNAFPVVPRPRAYRQGAPRMEGRRLRDFLADVRGRPEAPFIQMNHPRPGPGEEEGDTWFSHMGIVGEPFDPTRPLTEAPNDVLVDASTRHGGTDLDFDGIELMNGPDLVRYRRVRADWLSLLLQGERLIGTANSDSHSLAVQVGLPRTYVAQRDDRLSTFDEASYLTALRAGRVWGTTGPLLDVRLDEAGLGDLHAGPRGTLEVTADAAPWIPLSEWRAYVNGELVHRAPIERGVPARLPLAFAADAIVTVEVEGPAEGRYAEVHPGFTPFAYTNPIFVDADGNGRFDAPGLPTPLPKSITNPDQAD